MLLILLMVVLLLLRMRSYCSHFYCDILLTFCLLFLLLCAIAAATDIDTAAAVTEACVWATALASAPIFPCYSCCYQS
jgi:hypothetical protein